VRHSRYLLLALVLWLGQMALLVHSMDVHAHSAGDVCEICLHATPASGALPVTKLTLAPLRGTENPVFAEYQAIVAAPVADTLARGPPAFS
jgi:hypothetical protein